MPRDCLINSLLVINEECSLTPSSVFQSLDFHCLCGKDWENLTLNRCFLAQVFYKCSEVNLLWAPFTSFVRWNSEAIFLATWRILHLEIYKRGAAVGGTEGDPGHTQSSHPWSQTGPWYLVPGDVVWCWPLVINVGGWALMFPHPGRCALHGLIISSLTHLGLPVLFIHFTHS